MWATRKYFGIFGLVASCCVGIIIASTLLVTRLYQQNWWVQHTLQVMQETQQALTCLLDCETAARGYIITGDKEFLEPYEICYKHVASHLDALRTLTSDNPQQQAVMPELFKLADEKIRRSQELIESRAKSPSPDPALAGMKPDKVLMDQFRKTIAGVMDREQVLLKERASAANRLRDYVYICVSILSAMLIGMLIAAGSSVRRVSLAQKKLALYAKDLEVARDQALQASALKGQFVANVSHEVRTPLSGIVGLAELLSLDPELKGEAHESAIEVFNASKQLLAILNEILNFSKLEAGRMQIEKVPFAVSSLLDDVRLLYQQQAQSKGLAFSVRQDKAVPAKVLGDPTKIRQALTNLVANAIKFTARGGVELAVDLDGSQLRFSITDTGIGIATAWQPHIFTAFAQADASTTRKYGGTGLGLSIVKQYVELMGGKIGFVTEENRGSTFWFSLPLQVADQEADAKA